MRNVALLLVLTANLMFGQIQKPNNQGNCVLPKTNELSDYILCDTHNSGDQQEEFDITSKYEELIDNPELYYITVHGTEIDAETDVDIIGNPSNYRNLKPSKETVWIRVENKETGCYIVTPLNLLVEPVPYVNRVPDYIVCDNDIDGFATFDLTTQHKKMTDNYEQFNFTVYQTMSDATSRLEYLKITNSDLYTNRRQFYDEVWFGVENKQSGCYLVVPVTLVADKNCEDLSVENYHYNIVNLYPNPTDGFFKIELESSSKGKVSVFDSNGLMSFELPFVNQSEITIDMVNKAVGFYVVQIKYDDKVVIKKLIKN